jgi:hypothetical protein
VTQKIWIQGIFSQNLPSTIKQEGCNVCFFLRVKRIANKKPNKDSGTFRNPRRLNETLPFSQRTLKPTVIHNEDSANVT